MYEIDLSEITPTVAFPHLPENTKTFDEIGDIKIDQVVIGSCTNGHYKDLAEAAEIFKGKKVAKRVRAIVIPATQDIYLKAMAHEFYLEYYEIDFTAKQLDLMFSSMAPDGTEMWAK